ncbi:MAG: IclR family transcriptional regulator [Pseudomonadota bacterium]
MNDLTPRHVRDGSTLPRVRSVARAVSILRAFTPERRRLTLAEIVRTCGLDAGTTRRILVTLRDEGLVRQDPGDGTYCLSLDVLELASAVPEGNSLREVTESRLVRLARDTGATVFLSIVRSGEALCLARYHGEAAVQVRWWSVGGKLPLNCGAGPKVLLAHLPEFQRQAFLSGPLDGLTPASVTASRSLKREIDRIRRVGWAVSRDDVAVGLSAVAVPLQNSDEATLAAISVGGLTAQVLGPHPSATKPPPCLAALNRCREDLMPVVRSMRSEADIGA